MNEQLLMACSGETGGTPVCTGLVSSTDPFGDGSLMAKYELDGDVTDTVGSFDGTASNVTYGEGKFGDAGVFSGDGYVSGLPTMTEVHSMSFVFKVTSSSFMYFIGGVTEQGTSDSMIYVRIAETLTYGVRNDSDGNSRQAVTSGTYNDGNFHSCVATCNGSTMTLYIDSVVVATNTNLSGNVSVTNMMIGNLNARGTPENYLTGMVDQMEIYDRVLTESEVYQLYTQSTYCSDPVPDFVAHYPLTGTAEDTTGTYDGVETSMTYVDDVNRGAVSDLDGSNDYITISDLVGSSGYAYGNTFTYSIWVNTPASGTKHTILADYDNATGEDTNYDLGLQFQTDNKLKVSQRRNNSTSYFTNASGLADGNWHNIIVVADGVNISLILDNVVFQTMAMQTASYSTAARVFIGTRVYNGSPGLFGLGKVSNFRFYARDLSASEITDIYEYEKSHKNIPVSDGLISYFPLDNNSKDNYYSQFDGTDTGVTYNGTAAVFVAESDKIVVANNVLVYSVSMWINKSSVSSDSSVFMTDTLATLSMNWHATNVWKASGVNLFKVNGVTKVTDDATPAEDTWQFVYFEVTTPTTRAYAIGAHYPAGDYSFDGQISNVRVYDHDLSLAEQTAIYDAELIEHS